MEELLLTGLFAGVGALVLIDTVLFPQESEVARIPDDDFEKSLGNRSGHRED